MRNLVKDQTIPCDIGIHSYRGSTTDEKIEILKQYPKKMRTVILQDGTNAILKKKGQNEEQLFSKDIDLIEAVDAKLILMQVPPIRQSTHHEAINERIKCFNDKLTSYTNNSEKSNLDVLPIHNTMRNLPNYNSLL